METQETESSKKVYQEATFQRPLMRKKRRLYDDDTGKQGTGELKRANRSDVQKRDIGKVISRMGGNPANESIDIYVDPSPNDSMRNDVDGMKDTKFITSLFQSGNGKPVLIAADKVQEYEEKLQSNSEVEIIRGRMEIKQDEKPISQVKYPRQNTDNGIVESMFQTGNGRALHISSEKLKTYQMQLDSFDEPLKQEAAKK